MRKDCAMYDPVIGCMLSPDNFMQSPGFSQSLNRYSYCWNNPLKYTDPTGNELGVINRIGPGSGNHWSDEYRSVSGNFAFMSSSTFMSYYGVSKEGYNSLVSSWNGSGISQIDGKYYYFGNPVSYNSVHNNYFPSIADISLYGKNAVDFYNSLTSDNNLAVYTYNNIFGSTVAILGFENQTPLLFGNDATGYKAEYGYGVYQSEQNNPQSVGDIPGGRDWVDNTQIGVESFGLANSSKQQLIKLAAKSDASINNLKYVKGVKVVGKVAVVGSVALTGYQTYSDIQNGKYYSAATRAAVLGVGLAATAIPIAGWFVAGGIGLADAIWGDQLYNWVELNLSK